MRLTIGQVKKAYQIVDMIGQGGQGAVYRVRHTLLKRDFAMKVIRPDLAEDPETVQRFQIEAAIIIKLAHPYIVPLYDYWHDEDGIFIVMRYLEGGNLRGQIRDGTLWDTARASKMLDRVAEALYIAHRNDIVHRDIKPDNILLDDNGNVYLTDFGIAKRLKADRITLSYVQLGSPAYLSPEQILNNGVTAQTDIYTLGVTLYEVLACEHPYPDSTSTRLMLNHVRDPLPSITLKRPDLPASIDAVLQRATHKDPDERYPDVMSMADEFRQIAESATASA